MKNFCRVWVIGLLFAVASLLSASHVRASSYLDGEVVYTGTIANAQGFDAGDGVVDGVCHDGETIVACGMLGDDNYSDPIDIGFNFDFYGTTYTQVAANINGVLHFDCKSGAYSNQQLPTAFGGSCDDSTQEKKPSAILPFWDDLITAPEGLYCYDQNEDGTCGGYDWESNYPTIAYKTIGSPGSRKFIMQWTNMYLYSNPNIPMGTFQVVLYEGSNNVQIQYRNLLGDMQRSTGSSATIGIQKDLTTHSQFSYNSADAIGPGSVLRYVPNGSGGYAAVDTTANYDAVYLSLPGNPATPSLVRPADSATDVPRRPALSWSTAEGASNYVVSVSTEPDFSNIVSQSASIAGTIFSPVTALEPNTVYYWNVKASNETGETFSVTQSFTTGTQIYDPNTPAGIDNDADNIDDRLEDAAPNYGDGNNDGIPDAEQKNVASFPSLGGDQEYTALELDYACTLTDVENQTEASKAAQDSIYQYNFGLMNFTADCGSPGFTTTAKIYQYGTTTDGLLVRKYNSTTGLYTGIETATLEQLTLDGKPVVLATYSITDGDALDEDGTADGIIIDPVGLASVPAVTAEAGSQLASTGLNAWLYALGALSLVAFGSFLILRGRTKK